MKRAIIEQLLRVLTLRDDGVENTDRVAWNADEVRGLQPLLLFEGAELWLYRRVQQKRVDVPDAFKATLRSAAHGISLLNMRIDAQTIAVTNLLNAATLPWALMKGQARRAAISRYPYADARPVSDVDLLIPEQHAKAAWQLLTQNGFRRVVEGPVDWSADHHLPALIDASNVSVELHSTTSISVPANEAWRRCTEHGDELDWSGIRTHVPNATELVWQALSHGSSDGPEGHTLKAFLSVAAVLAPNPIINWSIIYHRLMNKETLDSVTLKPVPLEHVKNFLHIAASLAGVSVPENLAPKSPASIVPLLMWRARVLASTRSRALNDRLLEESVRVEVLQPITPFVRRVGLVRNVRRRAASIVARAAYVAWRAAIA